MIRHGAVWAVPAIDLQREATFRHNGKDSCTSDGRHSFERRQIASNEVIVIMVQVCHPTARTSGSTLGKVFQSSRTSPPDTGDVFVLGQLSVPLGVMMDTRSYALFI
ncbi:formate dehydrogenase family accessory protein FdhD [Anopheles sinensis]|uniref:Formate dehydrogenase family accessory protein FdhD n=1 Tax=Anopheles sinensis TaxID=74873 RepID=A0A084WJF7_ANOSI|nr:formate dehydrogenase family accessory protein FdhD [Anopheles sinensis]